MSDPDLRLSRRGLLGAGFGAAVSTSRRVTANETDGKGSNESVPQGKIRIGQIGTKHPHAAGKLDAIRGLSDIFELVGVVEEDQSRRIQASKAKSYHDVPWMSKESLLESDVAAIAVETNVTDLVPTAMACLASGKHIHLDKPAGESMQACRAMHQLADERGLTIQMGYMLRYNPAFELLFDVVRKGWLGRITEVSAAMGKKANDELRRDLSQFGGGGMFELACHLIDAMATVLGEPTRATAHNRKCYPDKDQFLDNQLAVFDYPHAIATIRCNHLDPFGFPRRHFEVVGEKGMLEICPLEPPKVRLAFDRPRGNFKKGLQEVTLAPKRGRYDAEFKDLARVIRGEKKLAWDSRHDLIVHEAILRGCGMKVD